MRFATDTGGTFTDLVVEEDDGTITLHKAATTPADPVAGVLDALRVAADARGISLADLLARGDSFIHGTTHAINAIIQGRTARTALIVTQGHRDMLLFREGASRTVQPRACLSAALCAARSHLRGARAHHGGRQGADSAR